MEARSGKSHSAHNRDQELLLISHRPAFTAHTSPPHTHTRTLFCEDQTVIGSLPRSYGVLSSPPTESSTILSPNAKMAAPQSSSSAAATAHAPTKIAVMTSGGDSAGMNAAVRSVVKMAIFKGCHAYVIREGWEGLVRGNDEDQGSNPTPHEESLDAGPESLAQPRSEKKKSNKVKFVPTYGEGELLKEGVSEAETVGLKGRYIVRVGWDDVRGWLDAGGTLIGTARCAAFREQAGRLKAAHNLIKHGIDALAVCGGDGSLTGADRLRAEWPELIEMLKNNGKS